MIKKRSKNIFKGASRFILSAVSIFITAASVSAQEMDLNFEAMPDATTNQVSKFFNKKGNILIADQFNNRVIEVQTNGDIIWQYGLGPTDLSDTSPIGVNDSERVGTRTLIACTGLAPGLDTAPSGTAVSRDRKSVV